VRMIAMDPSGSWLICACMDCSLYIVPVAEVVRVRFDSSKVTFIYPVVSQVQGFH